MKYVSILSLTTLGMLLGTLIQVNAQSQARYLHTSSTKHLPRHQETEKPIYIFAVWKVKESQFSHVLKLSKQLQKQSRKESGNLFYEILQSSEDANTILLWEGYINREAQLAHRSSAHYREIVINNIIPLLESRNITVAVPFQAD